MRYVVVKGSQSYHCCFEYTVVDTTKPIMLNGQQYKDRFELLCETFDEEQAKTIADALNLAEAVENDPNIRIVVPT